MFIRDSFNAEDSCDTMVALGDATKSGQVLFAKNSDRPQEECQPLVMRVRTEHIVGDAGCQFVDVPQARVTYRHVGSRPYWCAGYEHGFNEHQVVIGNEALPSKLGPARELKLIGMELLRLGLERSETAAEAVDVMTGLVEQYGQGKFENDAGVRTYDNSFIVADPREAYIIEAVGHDWAVKRVDRFATISNVGMLNKDATRVSAGAKTRAARAGLFEMGFGDRFEFAKAFADIDSSESGKARQCRSNALVGQREGSLDAATMMKVLADHSDAANPGEPFVEDVRGPVSLCVHRTEAPNPGVSAASLVADLCGNGERLPVYWCGLYSPCMTLFYPVFVEGYLPETLSLGGAEPSDDSPWWLFYRLTHDGLRGGRERRAEIRNAWKPLQAELLESAYTVATLGNELIDAGREDEAATILTEYMSENVRRMLDTARGLLSRATPTGAG
ncbi:MAG: C69 family dipeptidase [Dehalococcoidia bacterium]